ncbi:MAG: SCO family protein, partial [Myxococcaceae bacterium]
MNRPGHITLVLCALLPLSAGAQVNVPAPLQGVDVIEQLGDRVPDEGRLIDSEGQPFRLADELHRGKPVVLALVYYRCPQLCSLVLSSLTRALRGSGMKLGQDFRAVVVSIDPSETPREAAESKRGHMQALGVSPTTADWRFATTTEPVIQALAKATGFTYKYDAPSKQFA